MWMKNISCDVSIEKFVLSTPMMSIESFIALVKLDAHKSCLFVFIVSQIIRF